MSRRLALFILLSLGQMASAQRLQVFDSEFFDEGVNLQPNSGIQVFNNSFFKNQQNLKNTPPGREGCFAVASTSPGGESSAITRVTANYCEGPASTKWIPNMNLYSYGALGQSASQSNTPSGYFQVCCVRRDDSGGRRRRPGPR